MDIVVDYFAALGRTVLQVSLWVVRTVVRLLSVLAWAFLLVGVFLSYKASTILGIALTIPFVLGSGFVLYVLNRRANERWDQEQLELEAAGVQTSQGDSGGLGSFVVKVIVALIIVVIFFKYFVQIRLVPVGR